MKVGDLVRYKHNGRIGILLSINVERGVGWYRWGEADTHLVLWSPSDTSTDRGPDRRARWYVAPNWIEPFEPYWESHRHAKVMKTDV